MNRLITIPLLFFAMWLPFGIGVAAGVDFDVEVYPDRPVVGGFARIKVMVHSCDMTPVSLRVGGFEYPLMREKDGVWSGLVGFPLGSRSGKFMAVIRYKDSRGVEVYPFELTVYEKEYPAEYLKVPEKMVTFSPPVLKRVLADQRVVKAVCSKMSRTIFWSGPFEMPVDFEVKSPFGLRRFFNGKPRSPHSGVDLRAAQGTPVRAANSGRVALVRDCYLSGKTLVIDHGGGLFTLYAHLSSIKVKEGQEVTRGQVIAISGKSGRATGPHLHWGVSYMGKRLDPLSLILATSRP